MTAATYTLDLDGDFHVEDAACDFEIEVEEYPAEPYSHGGSRGIERDVTAAMVSVTLGGLVLSRAQAVLMFGTEAIERAESVAEDRFAEGGA